MNQAARDNGWLGFDSLGERVHGGWLYRCDGQPTMMGCGAEKQTSRKLTRTGVKKDGWTVVYGKEPKEGTEGHVDKPDEWEEDHDVVLIFCPSCTLIVAEQEAKLNR